MARINIEDSLFKDSRWVRLLIKVGCEYKALGIVTKAWAIAQEHWLEYGSVPKKAWPIELNVLVDVELAKELPDGSVYVKGSKSAFGWLEQRSRAGKTKKPKPSKKRGSVVNGSSSFDNGSEPLTLTPTLTPTLTQPHARSQDNNSPTTSVRGAYVKSYEVRYGIKPIIAAKENSLLKRLVASVGLEDAIRIVSQYPSYQDPWHVKQKHPLGLLIAQLDKVRVELNDPRKMLDAGMAHKELKREENKMDIYNAFSKHLRDLRGQDE